MVENSDIAISTGAYARLPLPAVLHTIRELAPRAEITSYGGHSLLEADNARAAAAMRLPFSVHGPFMRINLGSRNETRRRAAIESHRRHMRIAAMLGATLYVVHPDRQRKVKPRDPAVLEALRRSFAELRELENEFGILVVVENMPERGRSHFVAPGDLDLGGLGLALDVGHAAASGTLSQWLATSRTTVCHMHLHSNHGPSAGDEHLPLGDGVVDPAAVLMHARRAGASMVIEHKNGDDVLQSLNHLRANGLIG